MLSSRSPSTGWVRLALLACALTHSTAGFATLRRHAAGRDSETFVESSVSSGQVRSSDFRFSDSPRFLSRQAGSFLENPKACTLPQGLKFRPITSSKLVGLLSEHKPFTYVRYGDGDWYCALGGTGYDSNGIVLDKERSMCNTLQTDIMNFGLSKDTNFFPVVGSFFICKERSPDLFAHVDGFFGASPLQKDFSGFVDSAAVGFYFPLLPAIQHGRPRGVLPLLANQVVVLVGPKHLGKLQTMLNYTAHVDVPISTCWEARDVIISGIKQNSQRHSKDAVVFLVAGGIAARAMLYQTFLALGQKDTFIDVGASLDGFAGVVSRDYNRNISQFCNNYPEYVASGVCVSQVSMSTTPQLAKPVKFSSGREGVKHVQDDHDNDDDDDDDQDNDDAEGADDTKDDDDDGKDAVVTQPPAPHKSATLHRASAKSHPHMEAHTHRSTPEIHHMSHASALTTWSCYMASALKSAFATVVSWFFPIVAPWYETADFAMHGEGSASR